MKRSEDQLRLEQILRSDQIVSGGFIGDDPRMVEEIIEQDLATLEHLGRTKEEIALRMAEITEKGKAGLGTYAIIDDRLEAMVEESRGSLPCPFPDKANAQKTVTVARDRHTHEMLRWSDLSIHLIGKHAFFQGTGSRYRLDPRRLVEMIFE